LVVGLVATVVIVAVALVAAMVVLPEYRNQAGPGESVVVTGIERAEEPGEEDLGPRIPVIREQPEGWSAPMTVKASGDQFYGRVLDTGIGQLIVVQLGDSISAVDLGQMKTLWSISGYHYSGTVGDGVGVLMNKDRQYRCVDLITGAMTPFIEMAAKELMDYIGNGVIVTQLDDRYCARRPNDLDTCEWQARVTSSYLFFQSEVFGDGRWINTGDGVFNIEAGKRAPFGSDVFVSEVDDDWSGVVYAGPIDAVVKITYGDEQIVIQPWDTDRDRPKADSVTIRGYIVSESLDAAYLLTEELTDQYRPIVRAYSWQTGKQLWKTSLKLIGGSVPCYWLHEGVIHLWMEVQETPRDPSLPRAAIIDFQTGKVLFLGDKYHIVATGEEVIYASGGGGKGVQQLQAFDGANDFAALWSTQAPGRRVEFQALAHNVIAFSEETGDLWVLQR